MPQSLPWKLLLLPRAPCQQRECSISPGASNEALSNVVRAHTKGTRYLVLSLLGQGYPGCHALRIQQHQYVADDGGNRQTYVCSPVLQMHCVPQGWVTLQGEEGTAGAKVPGHLATAGTSPWDPHTSSSLCLYSPAPAIQRHSPARCSLEAVHLRPGSGSADHKQTFGAPRTTSPPRLSPAGCPSCGQL